ncbi:MAG: hypothetical protein H0V76_07860, partial [Blastocatellia bacterium]|nr:hypothetical protein [Blastocatellia bacterium]
MAAKKTTTKPKTPKTPKSRAARKRKGEDGDVFTPSEERALQKAWGMQNKRGKLVVFYEKSCLSTSPFSWNPCVRPATS